MRDQSRQKSGPSDCKYQKKIGSKNTSTSEQVDQSFKITGANMSYKINVNNEIKRQIKTLMHSSVENWTMKI